MTQERMTFEVTLGELGFTKEETEVLLDTYYDNIEASLITYQLLKAESVDGVVEVDEGGSEKIEDTAKFTAETCRLYLGFTPVLPKVTSSTKKMLEGVQKQEERKVTQGKLEGDYIGLPSPLLLVWLKDAKTPNAKILRMTGLKDGVFRKLFNGTLANMPNAVKSYKLHILWKAGFSIKEIAEYLGMTEKRVTIALRNYRPLHPFEKYYITKYMRGDLNLKPLAIPVSKPKAPKESQEEPE